jgi:hypothetical protein
MSEVKFGDKKTIFFQALSKMSVLFLVQNAKWLPV